jgi:hypothetical protein
MMTVSNREGFVTLFPFTILALRDACRSLAEIGMLLRVRALGRMRAPMSILGFDLGAA